MPLILIAEPHGPTRELLVQTLSQAGYRLLTADEPSRALEQCITERPDAVLIATDLPRYQGATLGKLIRDSAAGLQLPLLAVDKGHLGRAKGLGAVLDLMVNAYLPDASKPAELLARLSQLLAAAARAPKPTEGLAATLAHPAAFSGELEGRSLPEHLLSSWRLSRDGVLVIAQRELTRRVFLSKGSPINYDSNARADSLPSWLLERGTLTSARHDELLAVMRDGGLSPGAALVAIGTAEPGEELLGLLRDYARAKIAEAYAMPHGRFGFHEGSEFLREVPSLEIPALGPLYQGLRETWPMKAFLAVLTPQMRRFPVRVADFRSLLPALGLRTADLKLALAIDGRQTLREVLGESRDLRHTVALIWFLWLAEGLRFEDSPTESAPAPGFALTERSTARRKKPLPEQQANALREEAIRVLTVSYLRVLGVDIAADTEAIERAYHDVATRFHPDTYAEFDLGPLEDLLVSVQERVSAAYRVLSDEEKRKAYVSYLMSRADLPRESAPNVEAEIELKRGESRMKRGDWPGALRAFERAVSLNSREPEYYSFLAWATFKAGDGSIEQRGRVAQRLLKKALALNPSLERPQIIRAIIEDEVGDSAEARRILLKLLKDKPDCEFAKKTLQGLSKRRGAGERL